MDTRDFVPRLGAKDILLMAAICALYVISGKLGLKLAFENPSATSVWAPTGIAIASFLIFGYRIWPAIFLGAFLTNITTAGTVVTTLGISFGNTFEGLVGAYLVSEYAGGRNAFYSTKNVFKFTFLACMVAPAISATMGVLSLSLSGLSPWKEFSSVWFTWWMGDLVGALIVAPPLILWSLAPMWRMSIERKIRIIFLFFILIITGFIIFFGVFPYSFLIIPVLTLFAFRVNPRESSLAVLMLAMIAIWGTLKGYGPFTPNESTPEAINSALLTLQAFFGVVAMTVMSFSASSMEERVSRAKLEESIAEDEALLESIGEGIIATDKEAQVIFMNKAAEELILWKNDEAIGKKVFEVLPVENENGKRLYPEERHITKALKEGKKTMSTPEETFYFSRKDGKKFPVAFVATPVVLDGEVVGAIDAFRDITKEKELERAKIDFITIASHQLRTPISIAKWSSELLYERYAKSLSGNVKQYVEDIYRANQRLVHLVDSLLNVSRIEAGTFLMQSEKISIEDSVNDVLKDLAPLIERKKMSVDIPKGNTIVNADKNLLHIIFQNLIANAVKYTPEKGKISIDIAQVPQKITVSIKDTGYGIPEEVKDKIFTKLFRADNVRKIDSDGAGLGLYIVKSIIERVGGKIWFESEKGQGTTFFIEFLAEGMPKVVNAKSLIYHRNVF